MADILPIDRARGAGAPQTGRMRRWLRIGLWGAGMVLLLALLAACVGVLWLRSAAKAALPVLDGDVRVAGLSAPVTVRRDGHGVPHIDAATQDDLFVAQGYVTAQDRLWQMDAYRRNAAGELAEIMGPSLVEHDKAQRVLEFRKTAERVYANLPAADRARLDAYARGVNLFIDQHQDSLPAEFKLLAYRPRPWSGVDSVCVGLMMVQMLDTHWPTKLARDRIAAKLGNEKLEADLYPVGSWRDHPPTGIKVDLSQPQPVPAPAKNDDDDDEDEPSTANAGPATDLPAAVDPRALLATLGLPNCDGCAAGSNNWVVAGTHTTSGKPLLSNDMHLGITVPNIWYMADLKAPGFHATGVTLPGLPFVIAGHNEHVAWGFTALMGDVQDLYLEKLDGKGNFQDIDAQWKPLKVDHEVIKVRGGKDVQLDVRSTAHGPLLNPILPKETRAIALKWTLYDPLLNSMPLYQIDSAANWTEFSAALETWSWPTQNVVYADDQGHIAYHAIGKVPVRWGGIGVFAKPVPHDPLDYRFEWSVPTPTGRTIQGIPVVQLDRAPPYIPFEEMPHAFDPPSGFLATANSRVTNEQPSYGGSTGGVWPVVAINAPDGSKKIPYMLTAEWIDPYRAERIYKLLDGRDGLTPKDMLTVQTDVYSEMDQEMGQRLAYAIDHTDGADERLHRAADVMRSWDGRLTTDSAAASLVTETRKALWPLILEPKLGKDAADYRWMESDFAEEEIVMHAKADWLPKGYKNWDALLTAAVRKAMDDGKAPGDVARWTYGNWHVVDIEHPLATFLPLVSRIAGTGPHPQSGDTTTVKQVGRAFGPSQRFTMDWSNIDGSTENIALGESGNPYSAYFSDQWNDWYGGTTFALPFTNAAVSAQTKHVLRLVP